MYRVNGFIATGNNLSIEAVDILLAMDIADDMHNNGFYRANVFNKEGKIEYFIEDHAFRTTEERQARAEQAKEYIRNHWYRITESQNDAYQTYLPNIVFTQDLDIMFMNMPGYLKKSRNAA